jgi:diguanylate cyclase (GGDEF)-like protein
MSLEPTQASENGSIEPADVAADVEQQRITALRRGYRVASMVGAFQLAGYLMVMSVFPQDHSFLGHRWSYALMAMASLIYGVLAMRPSGWISTVRQATTESVLVVASSFVLAAMHARHGAPGHMYTHVALAPVAMLYSLLFPLPFRWSVPALFSITAAYPVTQVLLYGMSVVDVKMGLLVLNCAAVLSLALIVSFVHDRIFVSSARARSHLRRIADRDELTGLLNRRSIELRAREAFLDLRIGRVPGLVMLDVDRFKAVNTAHGFALGDSVLQELARRMQAVVDRFGDSHLGRIGGEEFLVVVSDGGRRHLFELAQELLEAIRPPVVVGNVTVTATMSLGWASVDATGVSHLDDLFHLADQAMYDAKTSGGDRICVAKGAVDGTRSRQSRAGRTRSTEHNWQVQPGSHYRSLHRSRLHALFIAVFSVLGVIWTPVAMLVDVMVQEAGWFAGPLWLVLSVRLASAPLFALAIVLVVRHRWRPMGLATAHVVASTGLVMVTTLYAVHAAPLLQPVVFMLLTIHLLGWALAMTVPTVFAAGLAALQGLVFLVLTVGLSESAAGLNGVVVTELLRWITVSAVVVAIVGSRRVFRRLQDQESEVREILGQQSLTDALTGLPNRKAFNRAAQQWLSADADRQMWLALLDLDHFKRINDELGHRAGDRALNETAEALMVASSRHVMLARLGGEEFAVLFRAAGGEAAQIQTTLLLEAVSSVRMRDSGQLLSASAGVARVRVGDTFSTVLAAADAALRLAKASGRGRAIVFDANTTEQMLQEE